MGMSRIEFTPTLAYTPQLTTREVSPGRLSSAQLTTSQAFISPGMCKARFVLYRGGLQPEDAVACLIDDYIYTDHSAFWTGDIITQSGDTLGLHTVSGIGIKVSGSFGVASV